MSQTFTNNKTLSDNSQLEIVTDESSQNEAPIRHVHVAIVGAGFSGLGLAIRLKQAGYNDYIVIEKASDVGGTWRDNTYPGCACDVPSHMYSFSFALDPQWSRSYSPQQEIWDYLRSCTERFGILPHIQWNSKLLDASWDEDDQRWHITTTQGKLTAKFLALGNGPLSEPALPDIPGIEAFEGTLFHSAQWKHDYDLAGKRVAVIGNGASTIQFVPQIQPLVERLTLFQRTPAWIIPRLDHAIPEWHRTMFRFLPFTQRIARYIIYWQREVLALGLVYRPNLIKKNMPLILRHLEAQVPDPVLREKLTPHYTLGCKRILLSDDFYPAVTQSNVELITERIREVRAHSLVTEDGKEYEVDTIICGTGFHVTDSQLPQFIHGRGGQSLADKWKPDPAAYLGTTVAGFPNLFLLIGPNTGLGHNSMVFMIEAQVRYILNCLLMMERRQLGAIEVRPEMEAAYNKEVQQKMRGTVWVLGGCVSWYLDANGRNTTLWPGFTFEFWRKTRHFDPQAYEFLPQRVPASHPSIL